MRHQAERGVTVFDHLRGMTQFKERFATDQNPLAGLCVTRVGLRTISASAADWAGRVARGAQRVFHRAAKPATPAELSSNNGVRSTVAPADQILMRHEAPV
jgi:CelD/BcsL family acetyltransferase involved in cellulose biosynthesis